MSKDKFGYYQVGEFKTYSKIEAIEIARKIKKFPQWIFNDLEFSAYDWTKEPVEDLKELYRRRAQRIRDRYDYIVIWYSGGADSTNVLDTFLDNNILVDEIAHCWSYSGDGTYETLFNEEIYKVAIPNTKKIQASNPEINHRVIDQSQMIANLLKGNLRFDWLYHCNNTFSPNALSRSFLRETIPDYQRIIDQGKKLAFIWGTDKPRIHWDDISKKFYCQFQDLIDNILSPRTQQLNRDWEHDEFFYWSPDAVEIIIKQCHMAKKILESTEDNEIFYSDSSREKWGWNPNLKKHLTQHGLHTLIYPTWDINTFQRPKTRGSIFGDRDLWYFRATDCTTSPWFYKGVEKLKSLLSYDDVFNVGFLNNDRIFDGIKNFTGPRYYLS
jgi:hypothetical protein